MKALKIYAGGMPRVLLFLNLSLCFIVGLIVTLGLLPPIFCALFMVLGGFAYLNLKYVLSNSIVLSDSFLSCRYSGVSNSPLHLFNTSSISCQVPLDNLSYVSLNNLRSLYKRVDLISIGQLKQRLSPFTSVSPKSVISRANHFNCAVLIYGDGTSRLIYTSPFNTKSLLRLYQELEQGGVKIFA
jgi:hypothetical protein